METYLYTCTCSGSETGAAHADFCAYFEEPDLPGIEAISAHGDKLLAECAKVAEETAEAVEDFEARKAHTMLVRFGVRVPTVVLALLLALAPALARADGTFQVVPGIDNQATPTPSDDFTAEAMRQGRIDADRQLARQRAENIATERRIREMKAEARRRELLDAINGNRCVQGVGCPTGIVTFPRR